MYEQHFGLDRKPFELTPAGADVFVGPQTARTVEAFRQSLASRDAVVIVSGHVGTGKTTLVHRAIDSLGTKYKTIRVGRMRMDSSEVLESLLIVLGVSDRPSGTMQRFAALRRTLKAHQDRDVRIFIVVEDALRSGTESLAELEALTAADAGESDGANIVVMGDENLQEFMRNPQLMQLQQRVRQRLTIAPLSVSELRGYLVHSFRRTGGSFERIFDSRSAALLHRLSDGIPRMANNLVDATLAAAAYNQLQRIPATFIAKVAEENFGLIADGFDFSVPEVMASNAHDINSGIAASDVLETPLTAPIQAVETATAAEAPVSAEGDDIPHLIQDTIPGLEVLSADTAASQKPATGKVFDKELPAVDAIEQHNSASHAALTLPDEIILESGDDFEFSEEDIPELTASARIDPEDMQDVDAAAMLGDAILLQPEANSTTRSGPATEIIPELELEFGYEDVADEPTVIKSPDWEGNPTYAEFLPDLDALDQALNIPTGEPVDTPGTGRVYTYSMEEIYADADGDNLGTSSISELDATTSLSLDAEDTPAATSQQPGVELGQVAAEIGSSPTLEQVDDKLAETLFGTEFCFVAEQAMGNVPESDTNFGELELVPDAPAKKARPAVIPVAREVSLESLESANDPQSANPGPQKTDVVHSLHKDTDPALRQPKARAPVPPPPPPPPPPKSTNEKAGQSMPKSIEDQMDISLPRTVDELEVDGDDSDNSANEQGKTGIFRLFRRS